MKGYSALPGDDGGEAIDLTLPSETNGDDSCKPEGKASIVIDRLQTILVVLASACTLASLVLLVFNVGAEWSIYRLLSAVVVQSNQTAWPDPGLLERPSVYVGIGKLPTDVQHSALPDTIDVFPSFFQPVDHVHRHYVFPSDGHSHFSFNGRVAPGDHRVLLTSHITMVAQFRVHDYGMERCRIVSSVPTWELLQSQNQTLHLAGDTSRIEVWNLTASAELDERNLSWETKPTRGQLITTLGIDANSTQHSEEFYCGPSTSLQTFEFICTGVSCFVELWQDFYFKPRFGIFVQQLPSI